MKQRLLPTLLLLLTSFSAHSAIINTSENPNASPGLVTYTGIGGWPTPQQDPISYPSLPAVQTIFGQYDDIWVAQSISLDALSLNDDDNTSDPAFDPNKLLWILEWWSPSDLLVDGVVLEYNWSNLAADQADPNKTQLTFYTNLFVPEPQEIGEWTVVSYFENQSVYAASKFQVVPEPITLFLFATGLLMLGIKRKSLVKRKI